MNLKNRIPSAVNAVLKKIEEAGYEAWCVGGCVRDTLLDKVPEDWDIATSALPEEVMTLFQNHAFPTGLQHGTVTVREQNQNIEVTTYRLDGVYNDYRHPSSVTFTRSLEEDLKRRDFTINAMAMGRNGIIYDPFDGQGDIKNGLIRCVGDPNQRFSEDALRMMRGLRFAAALQFSIHPETADSIRKNRLLLQKIAVERIQVELFKLLCSVEAPEILRQFPDVIGVFWSEVLDMVGFEQRNIHHCYDVWEHTLHALAVTPQNLILRCTILLHDIGKPSTFYLDERGQGHFHGHPAVSGEIADRLLRRLKCSNAIREPVVKLIEWHDRYIPPTEPAVRRALNILGEEDFRRLLMIKRADNMAQSEAFRYRQEEFKEVEEVLNRLLTNHACFTVAQMAVNGRDIMALGFSGKEIGAALHTLLDAILDGTLSNERPILLEAARQLAAGIPPQFEKI